MSTQTAVNHYAQAKEELLAKSKLIVKTDSSTLEDSVQALFSIADTAELQFSTLRNVFETCYTVAGLNGLGSVTGWPKWHTSIKSDEAKTRTEKGSLTKMAKFVLRNMNLLPTEPTSPDANGAKPKMREGHQDPKARPFALFCRLLELAPREIPVKVPRAKDRFGAFLRTQKPDDLAEVTKSLDQLCRQHCPSPVDNDISEILSNLQHRTDASIPDDVRRVADQIARQAQSKRRSAVRRLRDTDAAKVARELSRVADSKENSEILEAFQTSAVQSSETPSSRPVSNSGENQMSSTADDTKDAGGNAPSSPSATSAPAPQPPPQPPAPPQADPPAPQPAAPPSPPTAALVDEPQPPAAPQPDAPTPQPAAPAPPTTETDEELSLGPARETISPEQVEARGELQPVAAQHWRFWSGLAIGILLLAIPLGTASVNDYVHFGPADTSNSKAAVQEDNTEGTESRNNANQDNLEKKIDIGTLFSTGFGSDEQSEQNSNPGEEEKPAE